MSRQLRAGLLLTLTAIIWGAAFVAMPGHKGLYGPQGTGLLLCGRVPKPLLEGGTGSQSERWEMPDFLPDAAEAGTHNVPGIAGLLEGLRYLQSRGLAAVAAHIPLVEHFHGRRARLRRRRALLGRSTAPGRLPRAGAAETFALPRLRDQRKEGKWLCRIIHRLPIWTGASAPI